MTGDFPGSFHDFQHTQTVAGTQIVVAAAGSIKSFFVRLRQIYNVDIVTDACSVACGIVTSVNCKNGKLTCSNSAYVGEKVVRNSVGVY